MARFARKSLAVLAGTVLLAGLSSAVAAADEPLPVASPTVSGPLPGTAPGDPKSPDIAETHPFFSTHVDLRGAGFVEREYTVSGTADAYDTAGNVLGSDVPYKTRVIVRRPAGPKKFNGRVIVEWQNVSAGYDLDALWNYRHFLRAGYAWVGVSAQRVGVDHLRGWSPARYGDLDVTGGGRFTADQLSYDIFAQAAKAVREPGAAGVLGGLRPRTVLAAGASQSAGRMTVYYNSVLPKTEAVFDGYAYVVGTAPTRQGGEPVFNVLSETDVRTPARPADTDRFRRWEVAGGAHSGWDGQEYRTPISERDLGAAPQYDCTRPPFSRVPMHHVTAAAYDLLARWAERGTPPPTAPPLEFNADGTKARDELGLARGGIRLSQVAAPIALNHGDNGGETFCVLFGSHTPFDAATLARLYPDRKTYLTGVSKADAHNLRAGYLLPADARQNLVDAVASGVGG